jgi:aspartate/methionine/tyrosine aminotransferase
MSFNPTIVNAAIEKMGIDDFSKITIRDLADLSRAIEQATGEPFIHLEMGVPGLTPSAIGVEAECAALRSGVAAVYPPTSGIDRLKQAASRFIRAFIGVEVAPVGCMATVGSMQGTFATLMTLKHARPERDTVLFVDPGFPVQKTQAEVIGLKHVGFDIHSCRGQQMLARMEELLQSGRVTAIVYSNPNNPSWVCFNEEELAGIGRLATKYDVVVLEDLAYFAMDFRTDLGTPFAAPYQPTVARYTDNYVLAISGSKAFSYAGQRIGVLAISDALFSRQFESLRRHFGVPAFGPFFSGRILYTLSSGTAHSAQVALAAMMEAACDGSFRFLDEVREYGRRAHFMKQVLLDNGFYLVYDNDLGAPLADGFYFTTQYPGMTAVELTRALLFYGISVFPLNTMGSREEGVRICTSFITEAQFPLFEERIRAFRAAQG